MSKGERRRTRISSTIDKLPDDIKTELDVRLADTANTYEDLSAWLKAEGYEISKSAIGRYAIRSTQAAQRVAETLQRTQAIAQAVEAIFNVKVVKVNTLNVKPKPKRVRYQLGQTRAWKKAMVTLKEGDTIELFAS